MTTLLVPCKSTFSLEDQYILKLNGTGNLNQSFVASYTRMPAVIIRLVRGQKRISAVSAKETEQRAARWKDVLVS